MSLLHRGDPTVKEIASHGLEHINRERLVGEQADLVNIPSPTGQEGAVAAYAADGVRRHGVPAQLQEVGEGRANVIDRIKGTGRGGSLSLSAHMDTCFAGTEDDAWIPGSIAG